MNKMKTVELGARGQIVIPQEFRKDLKLKEKETLVIFEKNSELILRKQSAVLEKMGEEPARWSLLSAKSLNRVWENEDDKVWESYLRD